MSRWSQREWKNIDDTAKRELYEETGATQYSIKTVCVYSVTSCDVETFGMLYFAEISQFEDKLYSEIEKIELFEILPEKWTYPLIQPLLLKEIQRRGYDEI